MQYLIVFFRILKVTQLLGRKTKGSDFLPANTVVEHQITIEQARNYEKKRFTSQRRKIKLNRYEKVFAKNLFETVGRDSHILDIPCGNGRFYDIFANARKLTMADYSENMLTSAREKVKNMENIEFVRADISDIPLPDNCADLCFCMRLFHHMKTDDIRLKALSELARVSKKYVALSFYNKNCLRYLFRKTLGKKIRGNYITFSHIVSLAKQVALVPVARFPKLNIIEQQCLVIFKEAQHK